MASSLLLHVLIYLFLIVSYLDENVSLISSTSQGFSKVALSSDKPLPEKREKDF